MRLTAEQIKAYLERRLQNIKHNMEYAENKKDKELYSWYYAQYTEVQDILKAIR